MSVDANFYVLYGIELDNLGIHATESEEGKFLWCDEDKDDDLFEVGCNICYDWEKCDELGLSIINDPYDFGNWCVIGFDILDPNPTDLIQNIEEAKEKWLKIQDELKEVLGDKYKEPKIVYDAYYS